MAPESAQSMRQTAVRAFINGSMTVGLGALVALATGFFNKFNAMADGQAVLAAEMKSLNVKMEEREKSAAREQLRSIEADAELRVGLNHFTEQHIIMLREVSRVKDAIDSRRR